MRPLTWLRPCLLLVLLGFTLAGPMAAQSHSRPQLTPDSLSPSDDPVSWLEQFVPDSPTFWNNSQNWTSNYGPAYRDVVQSPSQFLACSGQFALCFHSGADPYPCHLSPDGRSADCKCTVSTKTNYVLLTAILNYPVYLDTVALCGADGSLCGGTNQAPVCQFLTAGRLIPGADVLSTFDPDSHDTIIKILKGQETVTVCPKAPYAGCMTAPCRLNSDGTANCKCPVFTGKFQLVGAGAQCSLGGDLVPSSDYVPILDNQAPH
jgi:hypothetical protein